MSRMRVGTILAGRYKLLECLTSCDHTHTFRALDEKTQSEQVVKFFNASYFSSQREKNQFNDQIAKAQVFFDPGLVRVFTTGEYLQHSYLVLERVSDCISLRALFNHYIQAGKRFSKNEIRFIIQEITTTLGSGVNYFTYLKPEHIFLTADGKVRLSPFNFLNLLRHHSPHLVRENDLPYLPSEWFESRGDSDVLVYSLGIILHELVSLTVPHHELFVFSEYHSIPGPYRTFISRAAAAFSANRLPSVAAFKKEFQAVFHEGKNTPPVVTGITQQWVRGFPHSQISYPAKGAAQVAPGDGFRKILNRYSLYIKTDLDDTSPVLDPEERTAITPENELKESLEIIKKSQPVTKASQAKTLRLLGLSVLALAVFSAVSVEYFRGKYERELEAARLNLLRDTSAQESQNLAPLGKISREQAIALTAAASADVSSDSSTDATPESSAEVSDTSAEAPAFTDTSLAPDSSEGGVILSGEVPSSLPSVTAEVGLQDASPQQIPPVKGSPAPVLKSGNCPLGMAQIPDLEVCIDLFEFPNVEGELPIGNVTRGEAEHLCRRKNKRLCGETEWVAACKGREALSYPYGAKMEDDRCNSPKEKRTSGSAVRSGSLAGCAGALGVYDLSGNLSEWVAGSRTPGHIKGGSYLDAFYFGKCENTQQADPEQKQEYIGFRCCADAGSGQADAANAPPEPITDSLAPQAIPSGEQGASPPAQAPVSEPAKTAPAGLAP